MDTASNGGELYGVYKDKAAADKAVVDIQKWGNQMKVDNAKYGIQRSSWDIVGISVGRTGQPSAASQRVDGIIAKLQSEFPEARIQVTGTVRSEKTQAELMLNELRNNPTGFASNYNHPNTAYTREMEKWLKQNPTATRETAVNEFERIIRKARENGSNVSNHLNDTARDISIPAADAATQQRIRSRVQELGGVVLPEPAGANGAHWHINLAPSPILP